MKTPRERYETDTMFAQVVDIMTQVIEHAQLTPSEIRDAATLACIHYEMRNPLPRPIRLQSERVLGALVTLEAARVDGVDP